MELVEIYDEEVKKVGKLGHELQLKWGLRTASLKNLEEFATEAKGRFLELGFIINVDITPALVGVGYPDVAIVGRVTPMEIDHDRKRKEITKKYEQEGRLSRGKLKRK